MPRFVYLSRICKNAPFDLYAYVSRYASSSDGTRKFYVLFRHIDLLFSVGECMEAFSSGYRIDERLSREPKPKNGAVFCSFKKDFYEQR